MCFVCIKAEHIFHLHWPGCEFLRYVLGPEAGGTAHLQSQGEGEAANPHRPVPQGFEPWTFGSKVQYPTPELPAPPSREAVEVALELLAVGWGCDFAKYFNIVGVHKTA